MLTAAEYRKEAEDYVRQADGLPSGARRFRLMDMARSCMRLADQATASEGHLSVNGPEQERVFERFDFPTIKGELLAV